ncbi:hypothetical protein KXD93_05000 [Mucilaginibacter sp. BJC16-A38]|uniref:hypothetical protein n=1 Tax=Mucilaginibacter phenanthrenivorans TaxID=1234842 RepID=UPI00215887F0|nr:hypothetical protein [Mucilaginibacter phenanthrenivorans]MCR8556985.1 hypothetical protein [Mucilaginibacter phenanthrenivorans]
MRKIILAILLFTTVKAFAQKADFNGTWQVNKAKIDFGRAPEWIIPRYIKVEQQADKIAIIRTSLDQDLKELAPVTENLTFDGKPLVRTPVAGTTVTTTLKWTNDQSILLTRTAGPNNGATENWTLEDGGKTLVIDRNVEQSNGMKYTIKCYYAKQ